MLLTCNQLMSNTHVEQQAIPLFHSPWKFYYKNPFVGLKWLVPWGLRICAEQLRPAVMWQVTAQTQWQRHGAEMTARHLASTGRGHGEGGDNPRLFRRRQILVGEGRAIDGFLTNDGGLEARWQTSRPGDKTRTVWWLCFIKFGHVQDLQENIASS